MAALADGAAALLDRLRLPSANLVGSPLGSYVGQVVAARYADTNRSEPRSARPSAALDGARRLMADDPDFGSFGRFQEVPVAEMLPDMRDAYEFTKGLRGLVPGPHKIWLANPLLSKTIVPTGAYFQKHSTLTKTEIEIVTNLIAARWHAAYASYEHEKIGVKQGHLPAEKVERIIAGLPIGFDDPREDVVYQLAYALVQPRIVSQGLYQQAKDLISDTGIVDVAVLIGWFTMVSATLNAFDVPSDAKGLDQ